MAELRTFPIRTIPSVGDKIIEQQLIQYVDKMLILNKEKEITTLPEKIEQLNQRIAYTDEKVNKLVYELYGLREEEVKIAEGISTDKRKQVI